MMLGMLFVCEVLDQGGAYREGQEIQSLCGTQICSHLHSQRQSTEEGHTLRPFQMVQDM